MILAQLMHLNGPEGIIRLSTLLIEWTDSDGVTWLPGGFLGIGARGATAEIGGGALSFTWTGASAGLLAEAQKPGIVRSKLRMVSVWIDDNGAQSGPAFDAFEGICETPGIDVDPETPSITLTVQSPLLDLARVRAVRLRGAEKLADYDPGIK